MKSGNTTTDKGCCGHPAKCAFTTASGRCKPREDFEKSQKPRRRSIFDAIRETTPREELERAEREVREEARAELSRDEDFGRTLTR